MAGERLGKALGLVKKDALVSIEHYKADVKELLRKYKSVSLALAKDARSYKACEDAYMKRSSARQGNKLSRASEKFKSSNEQYARVSSRLFGILAAIEREYEKLFDVYEATGNQKGLKRAKLELEKYKADVKSRMERNDRSGGSAVPVDANEEDSHIYEGKETYGESSTLIPGEPASAVTSVNVAPVTIDVTPIIEKAINTAVDKLNSELEKKLEEYVKGFELPNEAAGSTPVRSSSSSVLELEEHILSEEEHLLEKLKVMCLSLQSLLDEVAEINVSYHDIAAKNKDIVEKQRSINTMQRETLREQQGALVNQRLVRNEQTELATAQTVVLENQRDTAERQKSLSEAQNSLLDMLNAVIETERELEFAMKTVVETQKELISAEQSIIAGNAKNQEASRALLEEQNMIIVTQKEILASHKKLLKEQKNMKNKSFAGNSKPKASAPEDEKNKVTV